MWEKGIQLCKELAQLYEGELFDYERLSVILVSFNTRSDIFSFIAFVPLHHDKLISRFKADMIKFNIMESVN
jgi:hypothetical protein